MEFKVSTEGNFKEWETIVVRTVRSDVEGVKDGVDSSIRSNKERGSSIDDTVTSSTTSDSIIADRESLNTDRPVGLLSYRGI